MICLLPFLLLAEDFVSCGSMKIETIHSDILPPTSTLSSLLPFYLTWVQSCGPLHQRSADTIDPIYCKSAISSPPMLSPLPGVPGHQLSLVLYLFNNVHRSEATHWGHLGVIWGKGNFAYHFTIWCYFLDPLGYLGCHVVLGAWAVP